jgi:Phage integrase family
MTRQAVNYLIGTMAYDAGLPNVHPHTLRHSCGYYLADRGTDLRTMQDYLGHRDPRHTVRYNRHSRERERSPRSSPRPASPMQLYRRKSYSAAFAPRQPFVFESHWYARIENGRPRVSAALLRPFGDRVTCQRRPAPG